MADTGEDPGFAEDLANEPGIIGQLRAEQLDCYQFTSSGGTTPLLAHGTSADHGFQRVVTANWPAFPVFEPSPTLHRGQREFADTE